MTSKPSPDDRRVVRVWHARTTDVKRDGADGELRALALLKPPERARYERYRREVDREMFLLGRIMARTIVAEALQVPPAEWPWRDGPRGRPEIDATDCPLSFNLAHSAGTVVCGLSWLGPVGVDVEYRGRAPLERALIDRCCHADEAADIVAHGDAWADRFLQYWTLKESYLKAVGLGISVPLPDARFVLTDGIRASFRGALEGADAGWTFHLSTLESTHYVAVAASAPRGATPRVEHLPFPDHWWP